MTSALSQQAEAEQARVAERVRVIDAELRAYEAARVQARAAREAAGPAVRAALSAVRRELGTPESASEGNGRAMARLVTEDAEQAPEAVAGPGAGRD